MSEASTDDSKKKKTKKTIIIIVCVIVVLLVGCGALSIFLVSMVLREMSNVASDTASSVTESIIEDIITGGDMEYSDEDELPEGFPEDVPIYEDSVIQRSGVSPSTYTVTCFTESTDSVEDLSDFYEDELEKNGWEEEEDLGYKAETINIYMVKDDRSVNVLLYAQSGGGVVHTVTVTEPTE